MSTLIRTKIIYHPRDKLVQRARLLYFLWWCYEWSLRFFQFFRATSWPVIFSFGHFPNCKLYNHYWISILGASETEHLKSTPDYSKWSRTNLTWVTVDETWLDCGAYFLFHGCGTSFDPTLSFCRDTIGTDHNWTDLYLLTMLGDNLPILLIRKNDCNVTIYHFLIATWDTNFFNTNDLSSLGTIPWDCFGKTDLLGS